MAISIPKLLLIEDIKRDQVEAHRLQNLQDSTPSPWIKVDELYFYKDKIYIPQNSLLKSIILQEFHKSPVGGHGGVHKTFMRISVSFFWQNMHNDVVAFVKSCITCQQVKAINTSPSGLLSLWRYLKMCGRNSVWISSPISLFPMDLLLLL